MEVKTEEKCKRAQVKYLAAEAANFHNKAEHEGAVAEDAMREQAEHITEAERLLTIMRENEEVILAAVAAADEAEQAVDSAKVSLERRAAAATEAREQVIMVKGIQIFVKTLDGKTLALEV